MPSTGYKPNIQVQIDNAFLKARSQAQIIPAAPPEKRSKYGAIRTPFRSIQGFELVAASKAEARDYEHLDLMIKAGAVIRWVPQVSFLLPGGLRYRCDALVWWKDGRVTVRDAKGTVTPAFRDRQRLMLAIYKIEVELVR